MNVFFNRTTDIELLHPTDSRQRTVFRNICADNYQVMIGTRRVPDQLTSTISPQFHEMQVQASDFDSIFEASESWERSLTDPVSNGEKFLKPVYDNTSFVPIFQVERTGSNGNSLWFDGITGMQKVELNTKPLYPTMDPYYQGANTPSPILCTCQDTFWIFRLMGDGRPNCQYVVANSFEDAWANPSLESVNV